MEVAAHFRQMNNYSGVMAILAALSNASVQRLKHTFASLDESVKEVSRSSIEVVVVAKLRNVAASRGVGHLAVS